MKKWIDENKKIIFVMIVYSICSFVILMFHESWRDEAQAWLISRDLDFLGIINQMKYEGHFLLWYLILFPFAKMGLPYETIKVISWIIVNISAWLILKKSPFKLWIKGLFIFSFPMLYLYPVISRCYCLIPLAISLIAITYKNREDKPIQYILSIVLLANAHVIMLGLVGMLLLMFYIEQINKRKQKTAEENKKIVISFIVVCLLLIISILPLMQSLSVNKAVNVEFSFSLERILGIFKQIISCIIQIFGIYNTYVTKMILIFMLIFIIYELVYYKKNFIIISASILFQFLIYEYIYFASEQRASSIILIIFLFVWIQKEQNHDKKKLKNQYKVISSIMVILLIINIICGFKEIQKDIKYNYSSSKETAKYIIDNINNNSVLIGNHTACDSAIVAYDENIRIWNPKLESYVTYVTWDDENEKALNTDFKSKVEEYFDKKQKIYYIFAKTVDKKETEMIKKFEEDNYLIKIFESSKSIQGEDYIIYEINRENI